MTKKQITTDLNNKISEFFEEANVDNLIILKDEIHNIFIQYLSMTHFKKLKKQN